MLSMTAAFCSALKCAGKLTSVRKRDKVSGPPGPAKGLQSIVMPSAEMPFGGIKDSGYGSEGGPEALEAYLVAKAVAISCV